MRLSDVKVGDSFEIVSIKESEMRDMAIRLGITEGRKFTCISAVAYGPCIIKNNATDIAVGRKMAQTIIVRRLK